jgi:acetolactate synthase small subunit
MTDNFKKVITQSIDQWESLILFIKLKDNSKKELVERKIETFVAMLKPEAKEANISLEQQIKNMGLLL